MSPHLSHLFVSVRDLHATHRFYVDQLGLEVLVGGPDRTYMRLGGGGGFHIGFEAIPAAAIATDGIEIVIRVEDVDAVHARLSAAGVAFDGPRPTRSGAPVTSGCATRPATGSRSTRPTAPGPRERRGSRPRGRERDRGPDAGRAGLPRLARAAVPGRARGPPGAGATPAPPRSPPVPSSTSSPRPRRSGRIRRGGWPRRRPTSSTGGSRSPARPSRR